MEGDLTGEDRDYYGDAAVDMKFGSTATDASAPTGLENPNDDKAGVKEEKMKEQGMEAALKVKAKEDYDINTFEGTEVDENGNVCDILPTLPVSYVWCNVSNTFFFSVPILVGDDQDIKMKLEGPAQDLMPSVSVIVFSTLKCIDSYFPMFIS